ncbi:MAG: ABC transporter permease subunit [Tissierellia bacterium]|nr:ABC transporter permease subunit [Tissierellia bacterium]
MSTFFWLVIWQVASVVIGEGMLLASPLKTFAALSELIVEASFWISIMNTVSKVFLGFIIAIVVGVVFAILSYNSQLFEILVNPLIVFFKSVPVASFIIVLLLWVSSKNISIFISFMMGLPIVYINTLEGINNVSKELLEMAKVFRIDNRNKLMYIFFEEVKPFFYSAVLSSVGMCFKAGIAAEVIGLPKNTIGENLYNAKIFINTPELFAWTIAIVVLSLIIEKVIRLFIGRKVYD